MKDNNHVIVPSVNAVINMERVFEKDSVIVLDVPYTKYISGWAEVRSVTSMHDVASVQDPTNVTTVENNLANGNTTTDFVYNNSSSGTTNKELPALDLGEPKEVSLCKVYWYSDTFKANDFQIQYSDDLSTWQSVGDFEGVVTDNGVSQDLNFNPVSARYWRLFCLSGNNSTWVVIREMEVFPPATGTESVLLNEIEGLTLSNDAGKLSVANESNIDIQATLTLLS